MRVESGGVSRLLAGGGLLTLDELLLGGGLGLVGLLTLIQIAPVKIDPWSAIAKALGRAVNGEVLKEVTDTKAQLEGHILTDSRSKILGFNRELLQHQKHTREDFIEILGVIDNYEDYCKSHPEYKNSRCVHAVSNIERVYDELLITGDFLAETPGLERVGRRCFLRAVAHTAIFEWIGGMYLENQLDRSDQKQKFLAGPGPRRAAAGPDRGGGVRLHPGFRGAGQPAAGRGQRGVCRAGHSGRCHRPHYQGVWRQQAGPYLRQAEGG